MEKRVCDAYANISPLVILHNEISIVDSIQHRDPPVHTFLSASSPSGTHKLLLETGDSLVQVKKETN